MRLWLRLRLGLGLGLGLGSDDLTLTLTLTLSLTLAFEGGGPTSVVVARSERSENDWMKACAIVPCSGTSHMWPASALVVPSKPPRKE